MEIATAGTIIVLYIPSLVLNWLKHPLYYFGFINLLYRAGKTILVAGDNPIYALSSGIIPISASPSQNGKSGDYVNISRLGNPDSLKANEEEISPDSASSNKNVSEPEHSNYETVQFEIGHLSVL